MLAWASVWTAAAVLDGRAYSKILFTNYAENPAAWEESWALLTTAGHLNPVSADYIYHQAYITYVKSKRLTDASPAYQAEVYNDSLELLHRSLQKRPHWGKHWANLARMRFFQKDLPEVTLAALQKALIYAPREPFVLSIALQIGFTTWDDLDDDWQQQIVSSTHYLLRHSPKRVMDIAISTGWAAQLQLLISDEKNKALLNQRIQKRQQAS